jgi:hypothetical protein
MTKCPLDCAGNNNEEICYVQCPKRFEGLFYSETTDQQQEFLEEENARNTIDEELRQAYHGEGRY